MRDRLIELLNHKQELGVILKRNQMDDRLCDWVEIKNEVLADYLIENGVIVPPCKVGDTVYLPMETDGECSPYVDVGTVFAIGINERLTMWISVRYESGLKYYHTADDFGKTVFLTREEAEQALEKLKGDVKE